MIFEMWRFTASIKFSVLPLQPYIFGLDIFPNNVWHQLTSCNQIDAHLVDREAYLTIDSNDDVIAFHSYSDNRKDCHHQCTSDEMMFSCNFWNYPDSHFSPSLFVITLRRTTTIVFIWPMMNSGTSSSQFFCSLDDNLVEQLTTQGRGGLIHKPLSHRKGLPLVSFVFLQTLEGVI